MFSFEEYYGFFCNNQRQCWKSVSYTLGFPIQMDTEVIKKQVKWSYIFFKTHWNNFYFYKEREFFIKYVVHHFWWRPRYREIFLY